MRYVVAILALVGLLAGCSSGSGGAASPPKAPQHRTVRVAGELSIKGVSGIRLAALMHIKRGHRCSTTGGYRDIASGAEVVISDDAGHTLAITSLGSGRFDASLQCSFPFTARVPAGKRFYGIEVTHRGMVKEPESALGHVQLTLG